MKACHSQIVERCGAAMLAGDYVIYLEGQPVMWGWDPAIFATKTRA